MQTNLNLPALRPFSGIDKTHVPGDFIKHFDISCDRSLKVDEKIDQLSNWFKTGSDADSWYNALPASSKASWTTFKTEFLNRFPSYGQTKLSPSEASTHIRASARTMDVSRLGTFVTVGDDNTVAYHVDWVTDLVNEAKRVGAPDYLADIVREGLPIPFKGFIKGDIDSWDALRKAAIAVNHRDLRDKLEENVAQLQLMTTLASSAAARSAPKTSAPTNTLLHNFRSMHIDGTAAPSGPDGQSRTRNNRSNMPSYADGARPARPPPVTLDDITRWQQEYPLQLDAPHGHAEYRRQLDRYARSSTPRVVGVNTAYPLTPGSMPTGSRECFRCAKHAHGNPCPVAIGGVGSIPDLEREWRAFVARVAWRARDQNQQLPAAPVTVQLVGDGEFCVNNKGQRYRKVEEDFDDGEAAAAEEDQQGKD